MTMLLHYIAKKKLELCNWKSGLSKKSFEFHLLWSDSFFDIENLHGEIYTCCLMYMFTYKTTDIVLYISFMTRCLIIIWDTCISTLNLQVNLNFLSKWAFFFPITYFGLWVIKYSYNSLQCTIMHICILKNSDISVHISIKKS